MPEVPFGKHVRRTLRKRLAHVRATAPDAIASGSGPALHRLRLAVKRLRYGLEFAAAAIPEEGASGLRLLALMQERLGALADLDAFDRTYAALLARLGAEDERRPGLENLRAATRRERRAARDAVRAAWAGDGEGTYPEKLAASISAAVGSLSPKDVS